MQMPSISAVARSQSDLSIHHCLNVSPLDPRHPTVVAAAAAFVVGVCWGSNPPVGDAFGLCEADSPSQLVIIMLDAGRYK